MREESKNNSSQCLSVGSVANKRGFFGTNSAPSPASSSSVLGFGSGKFSFPPLLSEERLGQDSGTVSASGSAVSGPGGKSKRLASASGSSILGKFSFPPLPREERLGHKSGVVALSTPLPSTLVFTVKGEDPSLNGLSQSQNWPVGFSLSGEIIVREEGGKLWDGVDGDSPIPLNVYPPTGSSLDGVLVEWDDGMDDSFLDPLEWPYSDEEDPPPLALLKAVEEGVAQFEEGGQVQRQ